MRANFRASYEQCGKKQSETAVRKLAFERRFHSVS